MQTRDLIAKLMAQDMVNAAITLKVKHQRFIDTLVKKLDYTEEEATAFAQNELELVNGIGEDFFEMIKRGEDPDAIIQHILSKRGDQNE